MNRMRVRTWQAASLHFYSETGGVNGMTDEAMEAIHAGTMLVEDDVVRVMCTTLVSVEPPTLAFLNLNLSKGCQ